MYHKLAPCYSAGHRIFTNIGFIAIILQIREASRYIMIRILFLVVFIITLWVPLFNRSEPSLFGFPFFYWYQIAAIIVSSFLIWIVYIVEDKKGTDK